MIGVCASPARLSVQVHKSLGPSDAKPTYSTALRLGLLDMFSTYHGASRFVKLYPLRGQFHSPMTSILHTSRNDILETTTNARASGSGVFRRGFLVHDFTAIVQHQRKQGIRWIAPSFLRFYTLASPQIFRILIITNQTSWGRLLRGFHQTNPALSKK